MDSGEEEREIPDLGGGVGSEHYFIGEACERVGLSFRTVRHYDEVGLVVPSGRSVGGFRIYTNNDIDRLILIKRMKPLGFSLEEMASLLRVRDTLAAGHAIGEERAALFGQLAEFVKQAEDKCGFLRKQLFYAEDFVATLKTELRRRTLSDYNS